VSQNLLQRCNDWRGLCAAAFVALLWLCLASSVQAMPGPGSQVPLPSTVEDFFSPGTQENMLKDALVPPSICRVCHEFDDDGNDKEIVPPYNNWEMSMMGQATRDPIWRAGLAIANQDAGFGGDTCIRCHSPNAWLSGRSVPTDGSAFKNADFDGVTCNICHRLVNPVSSKNSPVEDQPILDALTADGLLPTHPGNAQYVVDPADTRRGPLDDVPANYHGVPIIVSPFHRQGNLCGTCHDVSNALFTRQSNGTYTLNRFDTAHPTLDPNDMMPEQRTYSEWHNSAFANGGVYFPDHRFGGDSPTGIMQSCQDCHMPKHFGGLCVFWSDPPFFPRPDIAEHSFVGANTWVIGAVFDEFGQNETGITPELVGVNQQRTQTMLHNASDMQVAQHGDHLQVRVINYSGHKLPTGYPEGRRMWLNVQFFDADYNVIAERGAYDYNTADLITSDTKVYESSFGIDDAVARATGLPAGHTFHLALNNVPLKDNRIPPIGFTNTAFQAVHASPVNYSYADGQYWDDTLFPIPVGAAQAVVTLYYQTTSKEYIEFLRDTNVTNAEGQNAYDRWVSHGMSAPQDMDAQVLRVAPMRLGDLNHNGVVNVDDLLMVINSWGNCPPPSLCPADVNGDNNINVDDLLAVILDWG